MNVVEAPAFSSGPAAPQSSAILLLSVSASHRMPSQRGCDPLQWRLKKEASHLRVGLPISWYPGKQLKEATEPRWRPLVNLTYNHPSSALRMKISLSKCVNECNKHIELLIAIFLYFK